MSDDDFSRAMKVDDVWNAEAALMRAEIPKFNPMRLDEHGRPDRTCVFCGGGGQGAMACCESCWQGASESQRESLRADADYAWKASPAAMAERERQARNAEAIAKAERNTALRALADAAIVSMRGDRDLWFRQFEAIYGREAAEDILGPLVGIDHAHPGAERATASALPMPQPQPLLCGGCGKPDASGQGQGFPFTSYTCASCWNASMARPLAPVATMASLTSNRFTCTDCGASVETSMGMYAPTGWTVRYDSTSGERKECRCYECGERQDSRTPTPPRGVEVQAAPSASLWPAEVCKRDYFGIDCACGKCARKENQKKGWGLP